MGGQTISNSETKLEALKLQSSAYGVTIPAVWGVTRIAGNLIDYLGFKAVPHTQTQGGKGGGVKVQNTTYTYQASVQLGLCHGPVYEVPRIWVGKKIFEGGWTTVQQGVIEGPQDYVLPDASYVLEELDIALQTSPVLSIGTVQAWNPVVDVADAPVVGSGGLWTLLPGGTTLRVNPRALRTVYGWPLTLRLKHLVTAIGTRPTSAMDKLGMTFAPGNVSQAAWSALPLDRVVHYPGLAWVGAVNYDLGTGAQVENHLFEVRARWAYHLGNTVPDVDPAVVVREALTDDAFGAGFTRLGDLTDYSNYCVASGLLVSPALDTQMRAADLLQMAADLTNSLVVWVDGKLNLLPLGDRPESAYGRSWTPNTTPVYDIVIDEHSVGEFGSTDLPLKVRRVRPEDVSNVMRMSFRARDKNYDLDVIEHEDRASVDTVGRRPEPNTINAPWFCDRGAAVRSLGLKVGRKLAVRRTLMHYLPAHFAMVAPGDLLTLTSPNDKLLRVPVRVKTMKEINGGVDGFWLESDEYPPGSCSAPLMEAQVTDGFLHNYNVAPGGVVTPVIFEGSGLGTATGLEVMVAATGSSDTWGGCSVWISVDGLEYKRMGEIRGGSRLGQITTALGASGTTVGVNLVGRGGQLLSASPLSAAANETLCYVGGATPEFVSYVDANLVAANQYTLTGLTRGVHASGTGGAHAAGSAFVRIDEAVARSGALDPTLIGKTLSVKLTSFNIYGAAEQSLADVQAFTFTLTGGMHEIWAFKNAGAQVVRDDAPQVVRTPFPGDGVYRDNGEPEVVRISQWNFTDQPVDVEVSAGYLARLLTPAGASGGFTHTVGFLSIMRWDTSGLGAWVLTRHMRIENGPTPLSLQSAANGTPAVSTLTDAERFVLQPGERFDAFLRIRVANSAQGGAAWGEYQDAFIKATMIRKAASA